MRTIERFKVLVLALLLVGAVAAGRGTWAASGESGFPSTIHGSGYQPDQQTAAFRTGLSTADSNTMSVVLATTAFEVKGRPTIPVSARFSASSQTCKVRVVTVYKPASTNYVLGISDEITLTGTSIRDADAYFAPTVFFDTVGATHARVMLTTAPVSGTVDLWCGSF